MKILFTSADVVDSDYYEVRCLEYKKSLKFYESTRFIKQLEIVECVNTKSELYSDYIDRLFYSNTHNPNFRNKGALEGLALQKWFKEKSHDLDEQEQVVKVTGRYLFTEPSFLDIVSENNYDLYAQIDETENQYRTVAFSMRAHQFREFVESVDWMRLEQRMVNIEKSLFLFANKNNLKICNIDNLGIECMVADTHFRTW